MGATADDLSRLLNEPECPTYPVMRGDGARIAKVQELLTFARDLWPDALSEKEMDGLVEEVGGQRTETMDLGDLWLRFMRWVTREGVLPDRSIYRFPRAVFEAGDAPRTQRS